MSRPARGMHHPRSTAARAARSAPGATGERMSIQQLHLVVARARALESDPLEAYVRRATGARDGELDELVRRAVEAVEDVPLILAAMAEAAEVRGVGLLVRPVLDHAADYFLNPIDHASELAFGFTGLLDDAYLALRIAALVQEIYGPLLPLDIESRLALLRRLLGPDLIQSLDAEIGNAILRMALHVAALRREDG